MIMKIEIEHLKKICIAILQSFGTDEKEAKLVSETLVLADSRGIHTHGVNFLPLIVERIKNGMVEVPTKLKILLDDGAVTHIDGGNGLGQTSASESMIQSISKAKRFGVGVSLVRNTNHIGLLAKYTLMATKEGMLGLCMCNSPAAMAPWGGIEAFFGTNPFSIGIPRKNNSPIILDMSTSMTARGKIRQAAKMNEKIPYGWAIDNEGNPVDDPKKALKGSLLPIGGPKGYGMAFFIDVICGLISGSKFGRNLLTFHEPIGPTGVGAMTMSIDIKRFISMMHYEDLIEDYVKSIKESKKIKGNRRIYLPGEIEAEKQYISECNGVEIKPLVAKSINKLIQESGLSLRLEQGVVES